MREILCGVFLAAATVSLSAQSVSPNAVESKMIASVDAQTPEAIAALEKLVNINSGTMNLAGVLAVKDIVMPQIEELGFKVRWEPMNAVGRAGDLVAEHPCPAGTGKCGKRILLIGHLDTVFEPSSSFQRYAIVPGTDGKVASGPGVNDMKGGLVVMLTALRAMKDAGTLDKAEMRIVLSGDEERHGDPLSISRRDMIEAAKKSDLALEFESGAASTARMCRVSAAAAREAGGSRRRAVADTRRRSSAKRWAMVRSTN